MLQLYEELSILDVDCSVFTPSIYIITTYKAGFLVVKFEIESRIFEIGIIHNFCVFKAMYPHGSRDLEILKICYNLNSEMYIEFDACEFFSFVKGMYQTNT